jgi:GUN4-like
MCGIISTGLVIYQISKTRSFSRLESLLKAGRWKEADRETLILMLKLANREKASSFESYSLKDFPCDALHNINQLWLRYSSGRFGFDAQKKIYLDCGGNIKGNRLDDEIVINRFGERVGWKSSKKWLNYDKLNFDLSASNGHLPSLIHGDLLVFGGCEEVTIVGGVFMYGCLRTLFSRIDMCNV